MDSADGVSTEERAAAAFGEWRERIDRGESVAPEDVIAAHPELADALRRQFDALRVVARAFPASGAGQSAPLTGRTLGRWRLGSVLGSGGMGTVFLGEDGDARVAVKVLHPHLLARHGFVERFRRESAIGARVRHANVVATIEAGSAEVGGHPVHYLVMEHVEGRTLRALEDELGVLPEALCRHVGREIAWALAAIHAAGAVHRDLKPDNVIVTSAQVVKVMDLGVAHLRDEAVRLSQTGAFVGSVEYGSPEQFRDPETVDARADLHALGLVLYELATGVHPFRADGFHAVVRRVLDEKPRPAAELNPQLSPFFEELVALLLEKDPAKRPASAEDVARILDEGEESAWWRERAVAIRSGTRRPLRRIRIPRETALYGRDAELARLRVLYEKSKSGDGQVALVEGEAGIGKSRLVDEFVGQLAQSGEDLNFVIGSYPPGGAATASGAFSTAYRAHLGDDESAIRAALAQTPLLAAAFAALLRGDAAPAGAEPLTKDSLQTVFIHATRSFAAIRPTIVLIDDIHFAPDEGRALFAALALAVPGHRILLVGATRPGLDAKWLAQIERLGHATRVALPRLSPKDLVRLLADSLKSTHLAEELAGKIAAKSDGNPFFVFEILRGLREGQFITKRSDGTWATTREIREIEVPSSVVDLVQARVSDLGRADRNVLEAASCVGFEFDPALVGAVLGVAAIPLLQSLGAIEKSHRLVRSIGRLFVFDHHQVMEVLYAGLSEPLREEYHAAIGAAVEARAGAAGRPPAELDGELCVELARHFVAGRQERRALRYLDAALDCLERTMRNDALGRLVRSLLAVPGLVEGEARCKLLMRNPYSLGQATLLAERRAQLEEAVAIADATGDLMLRAASRNTLGCLLESHSQNAKGETMLDEALAMARASGHRFTEMGANSNLGILLHRSGRFEEARERYVAARAIAQELGRRDLVATCDNNLAVVEMKIGSLERARAHCESFLAVARELGNLRQEIPGIGNLATIESDLGRLGAAVALHRQSLALAREVGLRQSEAIALLNLGGNLALLGSAEEGFDCLELALARAREIDFAHLESAILHRLGLASAERGDDVAARERHQEALRIAAAAALRAPEEATGTCALAEIAERAGRREEALAGFEAALAAAHTYADALVRVAALAGLVRLSARNPEEVRRAFVEGAAKMAHHTRMRGHFVVWEACRDAAHLAEAKLLLDRLVADAPAAYRELMLANVPLHREIAEAARAEGV